MAETVADANAQIFTLPDLGDWRTLAMRINGYKIAEELGFDLSAWGEEQEKRYKTTGQWELDVLHLRLMLFYEYRADYFTGYTYRERDDLVDSLLRALSEKTGLPYP